jgi:hypothetical protein
MEVFWPRQERLEFELQALREAGIEYEIVSGDPAELGQLRIRLLSPLENHDVNLDVVFPELYPYFRFQIGTTELELGHHHNPFEGYLCVIGRATDQWRLDDTVAKFVQERVPLAIRTAESEREAVEGVEEEQAEPFSNYYPYADRHLLLIDGSWSIERNARSGSLVLGIPSQPLSLPLKAIVREVRDEEEVLARFDDPPFASRYRNTRYARWVFLDEPIREANPAAYFAAAREYDQGGDPGQLTEFKGGHLRIIVTLFPEESSWRDEESGVGWVAVAQKNERVESGGHAQEHFFIRVARAGEQDFSIRMPELQHMGDKKIAVIGLGCLGAPSALEFARMGAGRLQFVDHDSIDPPTTARWPFGHPVFGESKVDVLTEFIRAHYPRTEVWNTNGLKIGAIRSDDVAAGKEWEALGKVLGDASLIYDAAGEHGVQRFLSEYARQAEIPYVWVEGRQGGWGGLVGRAMPAEACWACIECAQTDGEVLQPPSAPDDVGWRQPQGCGDPTFTGAGFDMQTVAMSGVRAAVAALADEDDDYPDRPWNVEVISLRSADGGTAVPSWEVRTVERRTGCPVCGE